MVFEPLESVTTQVSDERTDPSIATPPPPIRRDDELAAVTGELSHEIIAPMVPEFRVQDVPAEPPPATSRRKFRRQSRDMGPVATRTTGGTVVTFPPQNAPGSGPGEIGRITASIPVVTTNPASVEDPAHGRGVDGVPVSPHAFIEGSILSEEIATDGAAERAGFLVAPDERARQDLGVAAESGPWLLIDPEDLGNVPPTAGSDSGFDADADADFDTGFEEPGGEPEQEELAEEDADRIADLEYLFAVRTVDVGLIDLTTQPEHVDQDMPAPVPQPPAISNPAPSSAQPLPTALSTPVPSALSELVEETPDVEPAFTESEEDFDSEESLDELLAEFSAATSTPTTSTPLAPEDFIAEDLTVEAFQHVIEDPAPAGGLFFDTPKPKRTEPKKPAPPEKSPAEVFASETSLLPARTRRGDRRMVEVPHDAGHSWFNKSGELPLLNVNEEDEVAVKKPKQRRRRIFTRLMIGILIVAVIAAGMYVALNSIYL